MSFGHALSVSAAVLVFLIVLASYAGTSVTTPEQEPSRFTHYLTWHMKIKGYDGNESDAVIIFSIVLMFLSGYAAFKWTQNPPRNKKLSTIIVDEDRETNVSSIDFDRSLMVYIVATLSIAVAYFFFDTGKLFAGFGVFHNASELAILLLIGSGGKIRSSAFWGVEIAYILTTAAGAFYFPWPYDAGWFKLQGLTFDWALIIEFIRIYVHTRNVIKHNRDNLLGLDQDEIENEEDNTHSYFPIVTNHPQQLLLLIFAATVHIGGNIFSTIIIDEFYAFLAFQFCYAVTFPAYAYYVYLDTHTSSIYSQKRIYLPSTKGWKIAVISISTITLSLATVRIGLALRSYNSGQSITPQSQHLCFYNF
ncbi:5588_t:CDS:2 [Diversispora eburnea]|uniref:5588_t:CDS:1 n=1 Tax=Diversispora eburnea TaxID=1213867 RepID=A0A9N8YNJ9_9GLOM|nr:5588_t:CDS:2 [Diversispora eburnea]